MGNTATAIRVCCACRRAQSHAQGTCAIPNPKMLMSLQIQKNRSLLSLRESRTQNPSQSGKIRCFRSSLSGLNHFVLTLNLSVQLEIDPTPWQSCKQANHSTLHCLSRNLSTLATRSKLDRCIFFCTWRWILVNAFAPNSSETPHFEAHQTSSPYNYNFSHDSG